MTFTAKPKTMPRGVRMEAVQSSNITHVGYDPDGQILFIGYKGGRLYGYTGVPAELYADMMEANSLGGYAARYIVGRFEHDAYAREI